MNEESSSSWKWSNDVFLSFRGDDTRPNFVSHLNVALRQKGINVFIDDKLLRGERIYDGLMKTIEESKISIVIISKNFASSSWCLDELVKIMERKKSNFQMVIPIFYKVDPSHVRKQTSTFGDALDKYDIGLSHKMQAWREALTEVSHLSAWVLHKKQNEADLITSIVQDVLKKLKHKTGLEDVASYPVGIDSKLMKLLPRIMHNDEIKTIGIYGIGGHGKTTLARALYNKIANRFEASCFLLDVRKASHQFDGLQKLQETLIYEILGESIKLNNPYQGANIIRDRFHSKRLLLVLDDVDEYEQLQALAATNDWFGLGSKIIVTTIDSHLLSIHGFDLQYPIDFLSNNEALELFSWHAFKKTQPNSNHCYSDLSRRAVDYCKGLPLAIVVLGSFLYDREESKWKGILDSFENSSSLDKQIQNILRVSYDGLEAQTKEIFLYISCFLTGKHINDVKQILEACGLYPEKGITKLMDLSLLTIHQRCSTVEMHGLVQQMGHTIASSESTNPRKKNRLFTKDDVEDVLDGNKETRLVKAMKLIFSQPTELEVDARGFRNVKNLVFIEFQNVIIPGDLQFLSNKLRWIDWSHFPFSSFPSTYTANNLIQLNLECSSIRYLGDGLFMNCELLKRVSFRKSKFLQEIPDLSTALNLEELNLQECVNLLKVHESVGCLGKLANLFLNKCCNLTNLPTYLKLKSLKILDLKDCEKLETFPHIGEEMKSSSCKIFLDHTAIRELHHSIQYLTSLTHLSLLGCTKLTALPTTIHCLSKLITCVLTNSLTFSAFPSSSTSLLCSNLRILLLRNCNISNVSFLETFSLVASSSLLQLDLSENNFSTLPSCIVNLSSLEKLFMNNCKSLQEIPKIPTRADVVQADGCVSLARFPDNIIDMISHDRGNVHDILSELFSCRDLILTNCDIPDWYSYKYENSHSITFWMPRDSSRKLKVFAPCVVFKLNYPIKRQLRDIRMRCVVSINDIQVWVETKRLSQSFDWTLPNQHMWLLVIDANNFYPHFSNEFDDYLNQDQEINQLPSNWIDCIRNDSNKFMVSFKAAIEELEYEDVISYNTCGVHVV